MNEPKEGAKSTECSSEELDFKSEKFDPLKAIYSKTLKLPFKNIKVSSFEINLQIDNLN